MTDDQDAPTLGDAAIYQVAELTPLLAHHWQKMDGWDAEEAAHLLLGVSPEPHRLAAVSRLEWFEAASMLAYEKAHAIRLDLMKRAHGAGALRFPAQPSAVIAWAMSKGMQLPALLVPPGAVMRGGVWDVPGKREAPAAQVIRTKGGRSNILRPVIEQAIALAGTDEAAAVWVQLERLAAAEDRPAPLDGVNSGGIRYRDGGQTKTFTAAALRKRLSRTRLLRAAKGR